MTQKNNIEKMIDEDELIEEDDNQTLNRPDIKVEWYLIHKDHNLVKFWDMIITLITIYALFATPFLLIFSSLYFCKELQTS